MSTRLLLIVSGFLLMMMGVIASFMPDEILQLFASSENRAVILLVQLGGAAYFGMGIWLWMSKGAVVGGIYGRPLVMGAMSHFVVAALAMWKAQDVLAAFPLLWILVAVFSLLAVGFGRLLYVQPTSA